jgi:hypothetical protein
VELDENEMKIAGWTRGRIDRQKSDISLSQPTKKVQLNRHSIRLTNGKQVVIYRESHLPPQERSMSGLFVSALCDSQNPKLFFPSKEEEEEEKARA